MKAFSHYNDIIQVHKAVGPLHPYQHQIHQSLKCSRGIAQAKWHNLKLKQSTLSGKCCFTWSWVKILGTLEGNNIGNSKTIIGTSLMIMSIMHMLNIIL